MHGVHKTWAETAAVSLGTSHATSRQRCNHYGGYSKYTVTHSESHTTRVQTTDDSAVVDAEVLPDVHRNRRLSRDAHLDFHTAPEL